MNLMVEDSKTWFEIYEVAIAVYEETNPVEQPALLQEAKVYIHDFRNLLQINEDIFE